MVGAPESRLLQTKIIIACALPRERVTLSPEASFTRHLAGTQGTGEAAR